MFGTSFPGKIRSQAALAALILLPFTSFISIAQAQTSGLTFVGFQTELTSMELSGGPFSIPAGPGWTGVESAVTITLSSQRSENPGPDSTGGVCAVAGQQILPPAANELDPDAAEENECQFLGQPPAIDPAALDGQPFFVDSFFDVFFDITITDIDPVKNFAGQTDGASMSFADLGPAPIRSTYPATFDAQAANFGLVLPPEDSPYIGEFLIQLPLGADLNGNGEEDKVKFTLASLSVGAENQTSLLLPDGTVVYNFDSAAILDGAIVDQSADPPFTLGSIDLGTGLPDPNALGGPASASARLTNPVVPEPSSALLIVLGLAALLFRRRG